MNCNKCPQNTRYCPHCFAEVKGWTNEDQLQSDCKTVFDNLFPDDKRGDFLFIHHMNNQTWKGAGAKAARHGVRDGMPDIEIKGIEAKSFFIELKTEKGRLSNNQKERIKQLQRMGFDVYLARSVRQFLFALSWAGILTNLNGYNQFLEFFIREPCSLL